MNRIDSFKPSADTYEIEAPKLVPILNLKDKIGRTALHIAVYYGHASVVENLIFLKADTLIKDEFGFRPIDYLGINPDVNQETEA